MSMYSYQEAIKLMEQNKSECFFKGHSSESDILIAEEALGLKFRGTYKEFLLNYGAGSFGSQEIYGISSLNFENSSVPNGIWYTLTERREANLPSNLLVIYHTGGDEIFCLDFSRLDVNGEPPVVAFVSGVDLKYQNYEVIANDFGDFLLDLVTREINA